jgi:hypothetical protein
MDELRREVNKAFDQQQSQLGDLEGARDRMIHRALAVRTSEPANRMQLAAGLAAILIAALVIATFAYIRAGSQPTSSKPLGGVPNTTPLILYHDPSKIGQIDGITWDGRSSGRVGDGGVDTGTSNPAGTRYTSTGGVRDRAGRVLGPMAYAWANGFHVTWADDELHYCQIVPASVNEAGAVPGMLQLVLPGQPALDVRQIGTFWPLSQNKPFPNVSACSLANDRVVVTELTTSPGLSVQDWVVQLSTGRIVWTHTIKLTGSPTAVGIVATHDGQFVAESQVLPGPATATIFGPDGAEITHFDGTVDAFSWDGSLAVISPSSGGPVTLTRWRDNTILWSGPDGLHFREARAEPGGDRVAVGLVDPIDAQTATVRLVNLYVITAQGQVVWHKDNVYLD